MSGEVIATLGPRGTHSAQAAMKYNSQAELLFCNRVKAIVDKVSHDEAAAGVLPLENSIHGIVAEALDEIAASELLITQEIVLDIHQSLCGVSKDVPSQEVQAIYSHPQALGQCASYLAQHYPQVRQVDATSTAAAAEIVAQQGDEKLLAIGSDFAAKLYGLQIVAQDIEDETGNQTRFVVISKQPSPRPLPFTLIAARPQEDQPGLLHDILGAIKDQGINMLQIDSRPNRLKLGSYIFYIKLALNSDDSRYDRIVEAAEALEVDIRKLNS